MKNFYLAIIVAGLIACLLTTCDPDNYKSSYIIVNGDKGHLYYGAITDNGTNFDITSREYFLSFSSHQDRNSSDYFDFTIHSVDTEELGEALYYYGLNENPGEFCCFELGSDIEYDYSGTAVSGIRLSDYTCEVIESEVKVTEKRYGQFVFEIRLKLKRLSDNQLFTVDCYFDNSLTEY